MLSVAQTICARNQDYENVTARNFRLGYPRERFSTITSGKLREIDCFLHANRNAYFSQHAKKLGSAELSLIEKFLHGRVP